MVRFLKAPQKLLSAPVLHDVDFNMLHKKNCLIYCLYNDFLKTTFIYILHWCPSTLLRHQ